jgi:REP element-mobilizing transposase RayT
VNIVKSLIACEIFRLQAEVKRFLWEGKFWTNGYYINTVGQFENEEVVKKYVKGQGKDQ